MKKLTRTLSLILTLLLAAALMTGGLSVKAGAACGRLDMGDVVQMGDFEGLSHYIVFYPEALETSDAQWPVVVWANGTVCAPVLYTGLLKAVAAQGFVVVASADVMSGSGESQIAELDYILAQGQTEGSVFCGRLDASRIAAVGHSQGGRSVVNACAADPRICCAVSIAGSPFRSEARKLSVPTLFLTATADLIVLSSMWVKPAFNNCRGPAVYASLKNGIHTSCMLKPDVYANYCVQWLRAWLNGDAAALDVFRPGGALARDGAWKDYAAKNLPA